MWTKEDWLFRNKNKEYKNSEQYKYTQKCTWVDKSNIWYNVDDLDQLRYIHIMGGEPMLIKEHLVFLNKVAIGFTLFLPNTAFNILFTYLFTFNSVDVNLILNLK